MELAANVQKTLLKTKVPNMSGLDIGMISVPAKEMNGDYAYFLSDETNLGIAVADVIGKVFLQKKKSSRCKGYPKTDK